MNILQNYHDRNPEKFKGVNLLNPLDVFEVIRDIPNRAAMVQQSKSPGQMKREQEGKAEKAETLRQREENMAPAFLQASKTLTNVLGIIPARPRNPDVFYKEDDEKEVVPFFYIA